MIKQFEKLSNEEQDLLLEDPVLISVLASSSFNKINKFQKADAIKLSHVKTFTATPLLIPYYTELSRTFEEKFDKAQKKYFPFDDAKRNELKNEIAKVNTIVAKLDTQYRLALLKSFEAYERHVKKAAHSVFQDFIFPLALPRFADRIK